MTKRIQDIRAGRLDQVPPYCYLQPGMSPEVAALAAAKDMELTHPLELLNVLWVLRRYARKNDSHPAAVMPTFTTDQKESAP